MKIKKAHGHYFLEAHCARCGKLDWLKVLSMVWRSKFVEVRVHCPGCQGNFTITMEVELWKEIKEE